MRIQNQTCTTIQNAQSDLIQNALARINKASLLILNAQGMECERLPVKTQLENQEKNKALFRQ